MLTTLSGVSDSKVRNLSDAVNSWDTSWGSTFDRGLTFESPQPHQIFYTTSANAAVEIQAVVSSTQPQQQLAGLMCEAIAVSREDDRVSVANPISSRCGDTKCKLSGIISEIGPFVLSCSLPASDSSTRTIIHVAKREEVYKVG